MKRRTLRAILRATLTLRPQTDEIRHASEMSTRSKYGIGYQAGSALSAAVKYIFKTRRSKAMLRAILTHTSD